MFIDVAKINLKAGNGGNGAVAFRREKFEPAGGPSGGDGGNGGSIILQADEGIRTLMDFRYKPHYKADHGEDGMNKNMFGKKGEDSILKVPVGTLIKDLDTGKVIVDIKEHNQQFTIVKGGRGGKGNTKYTTATRQAPRFAQPGTKGQERTIVLELKLIADVGLIGFPNVGKSTILSILSAAKPKVANYHFTTLKPNLGVVKIDHSESFVLADIPGLIEGAHEGVGLGHDFLRHIERTRVLVHILDTSGSEGRDPIEDFYKINEELVKYNPKLADKPQIIGANKMDLPDSEEWLKKLKEELEPKGHEIYPISAATSKGLNELKFAIWNTISNMDPEIEEKYETFDEEMDITIKKAEESIIVKKEENKYIVEGSYIERLLETTNFESLDSSRYFQNAMRQRGIVEELKELGIQEDDSVFICGHEFEFFE